MMRCSWRSGEVDVAERDLREALRFRRAKYEVVPFVVEVRGGGRV
jgi:hypothetical protein